MLNLRDELTGLETYRAFAELRIPPGGVIGVAFDIAGLIWVNDNFGFQQGDHSLKRVAELLAEKCGPLGVQPIRYAGEEFLVLSPNFSVASAKAFAEDVIRACDDLRLPFCAAGISRALVSLNAVILRVSPETLASREALSEIVATQIYAARQQTGQEAGLIATVDTAESASIAAGPFLSSSLSLFSVSRSKSR
jgi:diguanylate cyclase (GGDEF)-like protein